MIFVTVGTHEQPFNRLIEYMDKWAEAYDEEVIMQIGYSTYEPKYAKWQNLYPYQEMIEKVKEARIVITHGGPSSFIMPLQIGKIPIVVPRQYKYNEHVNDHQVKFVREVEERMGTIITVFDIEELGNVIKNYEKVERKNVSSNNAKFNVGFENIVNEMFMREK